MPPDQGLWLFPTLTVDALQTRRLTHPVGEGFNQMKKREDKEGPFPGGIR